MSIFSPRPGAINAVNPHKLKRQPTNSFKAVTAIGAARQEGELQGMAMDKIGMTAQTLLIKLAKKLTETAREHISKKNFAIPSKKNEDNPAGRGGYPIPDKNHARNALARVSQHGTPAEKAKVRAKVHAKYPDIGKEKKAEYILAKLAKKDMPSFTSQDRPAKVKEIYKALKRDHPNWPAGKKARIANAAYDKMK